MNSLGAAGYFILDAVPSGTIESIWRSFLTNSDQVTHYVMPEFFSEPASASDQRFAVLSHMAGEVTAVLTGVRRGRALVSGLGVRPQFIYAAGPKELLTIANVVAGLNELAAAGNACDYVELFTWHRVPAFRAHGFLERQLEGIVMLDLSLGPDGLFKKFSDNKKTNIKKAIRNGVIVEPTVTAADIHDYHAIYCEWSRRKALAAMSEQELNELMTRRNRKLFVARHEGRIIAGVVVRFAPGAVVEYAANASLEDGLAVRPNDLLHWRIIEWACEHGFRTYSLGGAHLFLRKFGGPVVPTFRYRLDRTLLRRYLLEHLYEHGRDGLKHLVPARMVRAGRALVRQLASHGASTNS